ncbi:MAG: hypothetical protein U5L00_18990 [Desulfovermiculus sp.]|nr:hypothetical protein [Desulfovermiculus sp.]
MTILAFPSDMDQHCRKVRVYWFCIGLLVMSLTGLCWDCPAESQSPQAPLDEIREILRTRLYPPPEETELQALTLDHLAQDLEQLDPYARYYPAENPLEKILPDNQFPGIGAQLFERNGQVLLLPFPGGL